MVQLQLQSLLFGGILCGLAGGGFGVGCQHAPGRSTPAAPVRVATVQNDEARPMATVRVRVRAEYEAIVRRDSGFVQKVEGLVPTRTRGGDLRLVHPLLEDPQVATILLHRLFERRDSAEIRVALTEALTRTGGGWGVGAVALLREESDPAVRRMLVAIMRDADSRSAEEGIRLGLIDPLPEVRAEAAISAGVAQVRMEKDLAVALQDTDAQVRASAAWAIGILELKNEFVPVANLLTDTNAEVRLQALHAVERLDKDRAARLPQLNLLVTDPDARISQAAHALSQEVK